MLRNPIPGELGFLRGKKPGCDVVGSAKSPENARYVRGPPPGTKEGTFTRDTYARALHVNGEVERIQTQASSQLFKGSITFSKIIFYTTKAVTRSIEFLPHY